MLGLILECIFVILVVWSMSKIFHKISKLEQKVDNILLEEEDNRWADEVFRESAPVSPEAWDKLEPEKPKRRPIRIMKEDENPDRK